MHWRMGFGAEFSSVEDSPDGLGNPSYQLRATSSLCVGITVEITHFLYIQDFEDNNYIFYETTR